MSNIVMGNVANSVFVTSAPRGLIYGPPSHIFSDIIINGILLLCGYSHNNLLGFSATHRLVEIPIWLLGNS